MELEYKRQKGLSAPAPFLPAHDFWDALNAID